MQFYRKGTKKNGNEKDIKELIYGSFLQFIPVDYDGGILCRSGWVSAFHPLKRG